MQLHGCINHTGKVNVLEEMVLDQTQRVNDLIERNPLSKPHLPQLSVTGLNRRLGFIVEPFSQVAIDIISPVMQLFTGKVVVVGCAIVSSQIINEIAGQLVCVVLNDLYQ